MFGTGVCVCVCACLCVGVCEEMTTLESGRLTRVRRGPEFARGGDYNLNTPENKEGCGLHHMSICKQPDVVYPRMSSVLRHEERRGRKYNKKLDAIK